MDINDLISAVKRRYEKEPFTDSWIEFLHGCLLVAENGTISQDNIDYIVEGCKLLDLQKNRWWDNVRYPTMVSEVINALLPEESILEIISTCPTLVKFMKNNLDQFESDMIGTVISIAS